VSTLSGVEGAVNHFERSREIEIRQRPISNRQLANVAEGGRS